MIKHVKTKEEIATKRENHERFGLAYDLYVTSGSVEFVDRFERHFLASSTALSNQDLAFISRVNAHIKDRISSGIISKEFIEEQLNRKQKIPMCVISPTQQSYTNTITEIDINGAYWRSAYLLGIISQDIYQLAYTDREIRITEKFARCINIEYNAEKYYKFLRYEYQAGKIVGCWAIIKAAETFIPNSSYILKYKPSKEVRLVALGTLAKKTEHFHFDGKILHNKGVTTTDKEVSALWGAICHKVHQLMESIMLMLPEKDFLLYWVDALVVSKKWKSAVVAAIEAEGFRCKEKIIKGAVVSTHSFRIRDTNDPREDRVFKIRQ